MKSTTPWQKLKMPHFPPLTGDVACDVLVVGGGIMGLTAAYLLKSAGKRVVVLERDRIGSGDTGCTTAHLTLVTDVRLTALVSKFGREAAKLVWESGAAAINTIEQIARAVDAECEFRRIPAFLHEPLDGDSEGDSLRSECELANELGFSATYFPTIPGLQKPGYCLPNQAKFHPLRYLRALAQNVNDGGNSAVFERSEAREFSKGRQSVTTERGLVTYEYLVIATHVPLIGTAGLVGATLFQTKIAPYSTYAVGAQIPKKHLSEASYWDTADPYNYLRIDAGDRHDYAILGGEDHKTGQADDMENRYRRLEERLRKIVPSAKVDHRWSGQVIETHDGLPYIGEEAEKQFIATGFAGNGMTFGTVAGIMACDAAFSRKGPWLEIFAPSRTIVRSAWDYTTENADFPYYFVRDRLRPSEVNSVEDIEPGDGKILKLEGQRVACSRDEQGEISAVSAICTHMGCIVHWNPTERTWDCPCHGSRFQPTGAVLAGPAESALAPVDLTVKAASD